MRILAIVQGNCGLRISDNICNWCPKDWTLQVYEPPRFLPIIVGDPDEFLPKILLQADLVLSLQESSGPAQLLPAIAGRSRAKAALCPVGNSAWMPEGLKYQLRCKFAQVGVEFAFPKPFCTLIEETSGYRRSAEPYTSQMNSTFAGHFGRPNLNVTAGTNAGVIQSIEVVIGAHVAPHTTRQKGWMGHL